MTIKIAHTSEGTVVRQITASGERSWRRERDGSTSGTDHKGPWARVNAIYVPAEVLCAFDDADTAVTESTP
jgi:hypothetical protein